MIMIEECHLTINAGCQNFIGSLHFTKNNFFLMASILKASETERRCLRDGVLRTVKRNKGVLVAKPSLVGRHTYLGRDIWLKIQERAGVHRRAWLCSGRVVAISSVMAGNQS